MLINPMKITTIILYIGILHWKLKGQKKTKGTTANLRDNWKLKGQLQTQGTTKNLRDNWKLKGQLKT